MPSVWASLNVVVTRKNLPAMPRMLASPRLMLVRKLEMNAVSPKMVEALTEHPGIIEVDLEDACLSEIQPGLLVKALVNLEHVNHDVVRCVRASRELALACNLLLAPVS